MQKEKNYIEQSVDLTKTVWRHRKGNEIQAAIFDTIDALWTKEPRILLVLQSLLILAI